MPCTLNMCANASFTFLKSLFLFQKHFHKTDTQISFLLHSIRYYMLNIFDKTSLSPLPHILIENLMLILSSTLAISPNFGLSLPYKIRFRNIFHKIDVNSNSICFDEFFGRIFIYFYRQLNIAVTLTGNIIQW